MNSCRGKDLMRGSSGLPLAEVRRKVKFAVEPSTAPQCQTCLSQTIIVLMSEFFPKPPFIPAARHDSIPVCEWILPAASIQQRDFFRLRKALPAGMPDCLEVSVDRSGEGVERCTAAIYGNHAYLIHYEFTPRGRT
jgi:hypothetical protein